MKSPLTPFSLPLSEFIKENNISGLDQFIFLAENEEILVLVKFPSVDLILRSSEYEEDIDEIVPHLKLINTDEYWNEYYDKNGVLEKKYVIDQIYKYSSRNEFFLLKPKFVRQAFSMVDSEKMTEKCLEIEIGSKVLDVFPPMKFQKENFFGIAKDKKLISKELKFSELYQVEEDGKGVFYIDSNNKVRFHLKTDRQLWFFNALKSLCLKNDRYKFDLVEIKKEEPRLKDVVFQDIVRNESDPLLGEHIISSENAGRNKCFYFLRGTEKLTETE